MKWNQLPSLFFILGFLVCIPSHIQAEEDQLKIGVIIALTGDASALGHACKNGMLLAQEQLPEELRRKITLQFEDDGNVSVRTVPAFNKLVDQDGAGLIVTFSSGTSNAVSKLADQKQVPLIAVASDPKVVEGRTHVVNLWVTPEEEARVLATELERRNIRRIARINSLQDGMLSIKSAFDTIRPESIEVVIDEEVTRDTKDFRPFLTKLRAVKDLDGIFVNLYFGQTGLFAKQARQLNVLLPLFNVESFEDPTEVALSDGALVGQWYVQADDPSGEFVETYTKRFPDAALTTAPNCYDALKLAAEGIRTKQVAELNSFLHTVKDFNGALGKFSSTPRNTFTLPAAVKIVREKGFERLASR